MTASQHAAAWARSRQFWEVANCACWNCWRVSLLARLPALTPWEEPIRRQSRLAREHRLDYLGSGPFQAYSHHVCSGIEGFRYSGGQPERLPWRALLACWRWRRELPAKAPRIDWQRDYRSGYRWSESVPARRLHFGLVEGADIRVAWELARCHHLLSLALDGQAEAVHLQILDFAAHNPVGYGVQWFCAMEAAIRLSNWILAWELLRVAGHPVPGYAEALVEQHLRFIWRHLEWHPVLRTNHYLSNLCGLALGLCFLPDTPDRCRQRKAIARLLESSVQEQFGPSGANLESSLHYHRLSAEMVAWGLAALHKRGLSPSAASLSRLLGAAHFTRRLTRPDGRVVAFGDGDDGRFLPLFPAQVDDHRGLAGLIGQLFADGLLLQWSGPYAGEGLAARQMLPEGPWQAEPPGLSEDLGGNLSQPPDRASRWRLRDVPSPRESVAYADHGLYLWRAPDFLLAVRCGQLGQMGRGGHAHCDQLSLELYFRRPLLTDPGTFVYTALPPERNRYRCTSAHNGPRLPGWEQADLTAGLFRLERAAVAERLYFGPDGFEARLACRGGWLHRQLRWLEGELHIADWWTGGDGIHGIAEIMAAHNPGDAQPLALSPGYGRKCPEQMLLSGKPLADGA